MKFLNTHEIISAGTDGQLKLWDINKPPFCLRSFVGGHVNEKNFVGLATNGDYIGCGSEDNSLCIYYKVREPVTTLWPVNNLNRSLSSIILYIGTLKAIVQFEVWPPTTTLQRIWHRQQGRVVGQWVRVGCLLEKVAQSTVEHNHRRQQPRHHQDFRACLETR